MRGLELGVVVGLGLEEEDNWPGLGILVVVVLKIDNAMNLRGCSHLCIINHGYSTWTSFLSSSAGPAKSQLARLVHTSWLWPNCRLFRKNNARIARGRS